MGPTDDIITAEPLVGGDMAAELIDNLREALSGLPWESVTITIILDNKTKIKMSKTRRSNNGRRRNEHGKSRA